MKDKEMDKDTMTQVMVILVLAVTGMLSSEQAKMMLGTLIGSDSIDTGVPTTSTSLGSVGSVGQTQTISGMVQLAEFLGTSVPTACKISKSGKLDAARLHYGTRKFVWDKQKLLEIARKHEE